MSAVQLPVQIRSGHLVMPRLDVYYPVVKGLADLGAQGRINNAILGLTNKIIKDQGYYENPQTEVSGYYEIKTNERDILSLALINDAYSGGAHGLRIIRCLNMNAKTGSIYTLKDLFKPGADYVKRLSEIVSSQIRDRGIYLLGQFTGIKPDQDFYIADKSLVIFFQLYEIAPYAAGVPSFPISIYEIQDIINDQGPLKWLMY